MKIKDFEKLVKEQIDLCNKTLLKKSAEYSSGKDKLYNFKRAAQIGNTTPLKALVGMMLKHTTSILDMFEGHDKGINYSKELWNEKLTDQINYLLLAKAIIREENKDA